MSTPRYDVREAKDGQWYFVLIAENGEVVSTSETYTREADAYRAVGDVQAAAADAADVQNGDDK